MRVEFAGDMPRAIAAGKRTFELFFIFFMATTPLSVSPGTSRKTAVTRVVASNVARAITARRRTSVRKERREGI